MVFTKMQANGNDYIYIQTFTQTLSDPSSTAIRLCDRHFGIGGDGLVLLCPSKEADFRMRIFDPDGTEAELCGNALQCAAFLFAKSGYTGKNRLNVETIVGMRTVFLEHDGKQTSNVSVRFPSPVIHAMQTRLQVGDRVFCVNSLSLGNPHCVVLTDRLEDAVFRKYGALLERHPFFPERTNVEFVTVKDRCHLRMRTWERGCGETLSCSTGSAAALAVAVLNGLAEPEAIVEQPGGNIRVLWDRKQDTITMFSKAQIVFCGEFNETEGITP